MSELSHREKTVGVEQTRSASLTDSVEKDWSHSEEKKLVRKIDFVVLPLLILGFWILQLDRGNIGNVLTNGFLADVGITQLQFNTGTQLYSLGIVLFDIPSNIILYKVGPVLFMGFQIFAWSIIATFQAFQKGPGAYLATRFLLGCCEGGFAPAGLYIITRWYKQSETSSKFSLYFIGSVSAGGLTGLLAYGILRMEGIAKLHGWQWIFIIEGLMGVVLSFLFIALFPRSPADPRSLLGFRYFNDEEISIVTRRVIQDDPTKVNVKQHISREEYKRVFTNWKLIPHIIMAMAGLAPPYALQAYAPTLIASFGYPVLKATAIATIGPWILLVTTVVFGFLADLTKKRGLIVFIGLLFYVGFLVGDRILVTIPVKEKRFALLALTIGFSSSWHPLNCSWVAMKADTPGERALMMAVMTMAANVSGIIGGQLFQAHDAPLYRTGWSVVVALGGVALVSSIVANLQYRRSK